MHLFGWVGALLLWSLSAHAAQTNKWEDLPTDLLESDYTRVLNEKFGGAKALPEDRLLLKYVEYLQKRNPQTGEAFIGEWKKLVASTKKPLSAPSLALFEGSMERCWPMAFTSQRKFCAQSIGTITTRHLPGLVKEKQKAALELIALYPWLYGSLDGAEAESYHSFLDDWAHTRRQQQVLDDIRKQHDYLKPVSPSVNQ
jgi:hypothetical protein